jgi:hypothetical protein
MLCLQDRNTGFLEPKVAHRLMHSSIMTSTLGITSIWQKSGHLAANGVLATGGLRAKRFNWVCG